MKELDKQLENGKAELDAKLANNTITREEYEIQANEIAQKRYTLAERAAVIAQEYAKSMYQADEPIAVGV